MEFRVLGPLEVSGPGGTLRLGGLKERAVLAALVTEIDHVVSVDRLVDALWGDDPPETAVKTLRSYVSRLRARLDPEGESIETVSGGYVFHSGDHLVDARRFEALLEEARALRDRENHREAVRRLDEGLALWRGPPFHGLDHLDFAHHEAVRLEERRLEAVESRIDSLLAMGKHDATVAELEQLVERHPLREGLWHSLMIALYRSGRQAEALRAYQRARNLLGEELGIEPSPELRALEEAILLQREEIAAPTVGMGSHNLPQPKSSFIGREDDLEGLAALLEQYRCTTVTGTGGSGKTRLAIEAARKRADQHRDGVALVELASVSDSAVVLEHVGTALGDVGSHAEDALTAIVEYLAPRQLLLLLDNCEHLVAAAAGLVDSVVAGCPHVTVLATSREPLHIDGEAVFATPPLDVPDPDADPADQEAAEAFRLFVDRARALDREFTAGDANRDQIVAICRTLDGIPLAIELAAARTRTMSVAEIADRMDDRFSLLSEGQRTAPPRHQTLKAAIDWSYQLCPPEGRTALRRLSIFAGGWSLEAAAAVIADKDLPADEVSGVLRRLVDQNLVERTVAEGESRFHLLETIRQFAFDALVAAAEAPGVTRRHRAWYLALAEQATPALRGPEQVAWWKRLDREHDNLRAALRWSLSNGDHADLFRMVAALGWFWFIRGHWREAWRWASTCLDLDPGADPISWARVVHATGSIEIIRGNLEPLDAPLGKALDISRAASSRLDEAWCLHYQGHAGTYQAAEDAGPLIQRGLDIFEELGEPWAVGWSWRYLGQARDDPEESIELQERALARFLELGDEWCAAYSLYLIGNTFLATGRFWEAERRNSRALELARNLGDVVWTAHATGRLGVVAHFRGDTGRALDLLDEGLALHRRIGDDLCVAMLASVRGLALAARERFEPARHSLAESLTLYQKLGRDIYVAATLGRVAEVMARMGRVEEAAMLLAASKTPKAAETLSTLKLYAEPRARLEAHLREVLGADGYERLANEGATLGLAAAVERVLESTT